jgi:hypothetical protein
MMPIPEQPQFRAVHTNVGGVFAKGDLIPAGTYSDEQLARLLGLGAIEEVPADAPRPTPTSTEPVVAHLPPSAEAFQAAQTEAALATAAGEAPSPAGTTDQGEDKGASPPGTPEEPLAEDLTEAQLEALTAAGYRSRADLDAASDEALLAVPGIGPAALRRLREGRAE